MSVRIVDKEDMADFILGLIPDDLDHIEITEENIEQLQNIYRSFFFDCVHRRLDSGADWIITKRDLKSVVKFRVEVEGNYLGHRRLSQVGLNTPLVGTIPCPDISASNLPTLLT